MKGLSAALAAFLFLAGCGNPTTLATIPLAACPPPPILPKVSATELQTISGDAYRRLVERELRLKEYIGQLRVFCHD